MAARTSRSKWYRLRYARLATSPPAASARRSAMSASRSVRSLAAPKVCHPTRSSWTTGRRLAFGRDELRPPSGTGAEFFISGTPLGLTIVESLDTLFLMELDGELTAAVNWIAGNLNFDHDASVEVFETIIRMVGGL